MSAAVSSPWKPCDLRGVYPEALDEALLQRTGAAIASEMEPGERMVVGGDFRTSTPALKKALIDGLTSAGIDVIDCGQAPTPLFYFHLAESLADGVCIVTASHNPATYNGLKWMVHGAPPSPSAIARVRADAEAGRYRSTSHRGGVSSADPAPSYKEWMNTRWRALDCAAFGPIVIDAGNGAWSHLAPAILADLGFQFEALFCEPDGRFPNRPPDCARSGNLTALRTAVVERGARLGIAWDGDGDRVAFVDESGAHTTADEVSVLLARSVLSQAPAGEPVICDIKLADVVRREIERLGGAPALERSGHAFMRSRLLSEQAILGLDACGHYFFREAGSRDDGLYSALQIIQMMGTDGSLAAMRRSAGPLFATPELRIPASVMNFHTLSNRIRDAFPRGEEMYIDGVRLGLQGGIVLVRESSTEPIVSLRIEGCSEPQLLEIVARCLAACPEARASMERQLEGSRV